VCQATNQSKAGSKHDVSEEYISSILRIKEEAKQATSMTKAASNQHDEGSKQP
jgi:hypothetical protein